MAETYQLPVNSPAARGPSAAAYAILFTTTQESVLGVHVCNTNATTVTFRIALVESGYVLPGGNDPALYHFIHYDEILEPKQSFDTSVFTMGIGTRIVIWTDTAGVTFLPAGPQM